MIKGNGMELSAERKAEIKAMINSEIILINSSLEAIETIDAGFENFKTESSEPARAFAQNNILFALSYLRGYISEIKKVIPNVSSEIDPLYEDALKIVIEHQAPRISTVQRHLRIGYNRAARLLEEMERKGVVSHMKSDGTREIMNAEVQS